MNSKTGRLIRLLLFPFAVIYGVVIAVRNFLFDKNILKASSFNFPVICIGNLSVGGTGKSPMVEYLVRLLKNDYKTATISRGYKRKTRGYVLAGEKTTAIDIGDEPMQFHKKFPEIAVAVGEERAIAIPLLLFDRPETEVIILDDAFQHRAVAAGLNILLTDYNQLFTRDFCLPTGNLRDIRSSYKRADIIIVTKCDESKIETKKQSITKELNLLPEQQLFFTSIHYGHPYHLLTKTILPLDKKTRILLVCGIANPAALKTYLQQETGGYDALYFKDHHIFNIDDLTRIKEKYNAMEGEKKMMIVTEKDAVRLEKFDTALEDIPIYVLPIEHRFLFNQAPMFDTLVTDYINGFEKTK